MNIQDGITRVREVVVANALDDAQCTAEKLVAFLTAMHDADADRWEPDTFTWNMNTALEMAQKLKESLANAQLQ